MFVFPFTSLSETDPVEKFVRAQLEFMSELVDNRYTFVWSYRIGGKF